MQGQALLREAGMSLEDAEADEVVLLKRLPPGMTMVMMVPVSQEVYVRAGTIYEKVDSNS